MRRLLRSRGAVVAVMMLASLPHDALVAQVRAGPPDAAARAEALVREGRVASAEAVLYGAARRRPRDPDVRLALGRLVAARGATRVGTVLLDEARRFGAPAETVARELAPLYLRMGAWRALAAMPGASPGAAERVRLAWLVARDTVPWGGADSAVLPLRAPRTGGSLGVVTLDVGGRELQVDVDPARAGLEVDRTLLREPWLRRFASGADAAYAVEEVRAGGVRLGDLPVGVGVLGPRRAAIGLDVLARLAPRAEGGRLVLRRATRLPRADGERLAFVFDTAGVLRVARGGRLVSVADVARELTSRGWTLDVRRGEIVVGR